MQIKKFVLDGRIVEVVTISGLAELSERSQKTIRKMMERGILPEANIRTPETPKQEGSRLYTYNMAIDVAKIIKNFAQGVKVTENQKQAIRDLFMHEKIEYNL